MSSSKQLPGSKDKLKKVITTLHNNDMGTRGGPIAVMYVRGVGIYARLYFSLLNYLFSVFLCRSNPGVRHLRKLFVSVLFFGSE
jgi:hypothetical protein